MRELLASLALVLLAGCGGAGYRVVSSLHEVELTPQLAVAPTSARSSDDATAVADVDTGLLRGLVTSAPSHRFERGDATGFTIQVELSQLESRDGGTLLASEVTITDSRGATVDEIHVAFDYDGDETAAGEELGRRVGHYLSHRDGYHL